MLPRTKVAGLCVLLSVRFAEETGATSLLLVALVVSPPPTTDAVLVTVGRTVPAPTLTSKLKVLVLLPVAKGIAEELVQVTNSP